MGSVTGVNEATRLGTLSIATERPICPDNRLVCHQLSSGRATIKLLRQFKIYESHRSSITVAYFVGEVFYRLMNGALHRYFDDRNPNLIARFNLKFRDRLRQSDLFGMFICLYAESGLKFKESGRSRLRYQL